MDTFIDYLLTTLQTVHIRTYYRMAPENVQMPYAVFTFPLGTPDEHREDFSLDINIWGTKQDIQSVDTLPQSYKSVLDRLQANEPGFTTRIRYNGSMRIPDPDTNIERREVRFLCQTYWK